MKHIFIFLFVTSFLSSNAFCKKDTTIVPQDENIETLWMSGKIITKAFTNKIAKENPDVQEFYFRHFYSDYFIKLSESRLNEDLSSYIDSYVRINAEIKNGQWDSDNPNVQSRVGDYIVIHHIEKVKEPVKINFVDGNNNEYLIEPDRINYQAVTPQESSSGVYDGGDSTEIPIEKEDFMNAYFLAENAFVNQQLHLINRVKNSVIIKITFPDEVLRAIIIDSREIQELQGFLESFEKEGEN